MKAAGVLLVLFAIYVIYGLHAEKAASSRSFAMCNSIVAGSATAGLRERALADGADERQSRWRMVGEAGELAITYIGMPPFSRHVCLVKAKDGRVVSAELGYLD
jgi:hypothetical protein